MTDARLAATRETEADVREAGRPDRLRPHTVAAMFGQIARRYDLLNTLMTFGMDEGWRRRTVAEAALPPGGLALDVGTGTGALALALARAMPDGRVVGVDFTPPMLQRAPARAHAAALADRAHFALADAQALPFHAASFDRVTSAFAMRNVADRLLAFREQARILKPGGLALCLELTRPSTPLFRHLFRLYFHHWVPVLGGLVSGNAAAYTYLPESVDGFPRPELLTGLLEEAGFADVRCHLLGLGTVALHVARRR